MRATQITIPELILVGATRAMVGAGLGLLLADHLSPDQRRAAGWTLFLIGALSTIPLAFEVLGHRSGSRAERAVRLSRGLADKPSQELNPQI
jgi:hypothetical protein